MNVGDLIDQLLKGGTFLALAKMWWDRRTERQKEKTAADTTKMTAQTDYEKSILSTASTMVEALMKDLRDDVGRLREQVAALTEENERLKEENRSLKERIKNLEEHRV